MAVYPDPLIGTACAEWAMHDTNTIDTNIGFIPAVDGTFEGRLRGDSADRTFNVLKGVFYPLDIKLAKATGATASMELLVIRFVKTF